MKTCVDCGSNEIAKNLNTNVISCTDCKSNRIYRTCYQCKKIIKEEPFDGRENWHDDIKWIKYSNHSDELVTCYEDYKIDQEVEANCS